jgi:DNA-binding Lrp family transcriptional regulator
VEYATQLRKILASHPLMTMAELASKINVSPAWLAERFKLLKYSDDIKTMIDAGQIGLSNAFVMSRLPESEVPNFIDRAMTQSPEEFAAAVKERVAEVNQARREGRDVKEEEFVPHAKIRKAGEIKEALDNPRFLSELIVNKGITDPAEAAIYSIKWICSLDDESVAVSRAKWEARKNDLEEAKARRKAERDAKKAKEAADKAAEITEDTNIV